MSVVKGRFIDESTPIKSNSDPVAGEDLARKSYVDSAAAAAAAGKLDASTVGVTVAELDGSGKVPASQLPSYVDDVLEFADLAAFPATGESEKIYIALDTGKTYRWSGSVYVEIIASPGTTDAIAEGSVNLYYTDARADARAQAIVDAKVPTGPMQIAFGSPDGSTLDRSEFLTYDASVGFLLNVGGQMATRSLAQDPVDPQSVVLNDKVEVFGDDGTGPAYSRLKRDYVEAKKVLPTKELSASVGFDGVDSWLGVSETTNSGNNISMAKIFPNKAQLFTVDIGAGTGPQPILPVEQYDLAVKKYVDDGLGLKLDASEKGAANGVAELGADGKVPSSQLSAIAITDTFVVASEAAMLALSAEKGDVAVRTDLNKSFILSGSDPTVLADWQELLSPTDAVQSVNGQTGTVSLDSDDVAEGSTNLYYTTARAALKQDSLGTGTESQYLRGDLTWQPITTSYPVAQMKFVAKHGVDATADGSQEKPYLTIAAAMASITDATPTKRYVVRIAAGNYTEASVSIKANVFLVGESKESVRITGAVSMNADFNQPSGNDCRSGASMVTFVSAADFNWATVTSPAGKLYFNEVVFASTVNLYGHNNAIAQAQFDSCITFGAMTISGINVGVYNNCINYANLTLSQHPNGGMATILAANGGYVGGTVTLNTTVTDFNRRCSLFARSFYMGALTVNGASSYADVTDSSLPPAGPTVTNSGNVVYLNPGAANKSLSNLSYPTAVNQPIMPAATSTTNLGDWGKQWMFIMGYVHASSGTDLYLTSVMQNYDPAGDSAGRAIYIQADGYGLQTNVNGGNIELETAAVSGTGVRGKVQIKARELDMTSTKITNLADATNASDAVTLGQVQGSLATWAKATFTLTAQNITDGYIDLADLAKANSTILKSGGVVHEEGAAESYTVSTVSGVSRITFLNDLVSGSTALIAGDKVYVQYQK